MDWIFELIDNNESRSAVDRETMHGISQAVLHGNWEESQRLAEGVLRAGVLDYRVLAHFLLGDFISHGPEASFGLWKVAAQLLAGLKPADDDDDDGGDVKLFRALEWLCRNIKDNAERQTRMKQKLWERWLGASSASGIEQTQSSLDQFTAEVERLLPASQEVASSLRNVRRWFDDSWVRAHGCDENDKEVAAVASPLECDSDPSTTQEVNIGISPNAPSTSLAPVSQAVTRTQLGQNTVASPALTQLLDRMQIFESLVADSSFFKAAIVAQEVQSEIQSFDPVTYLPELFRSFYAGLATHSENIEAFLGSQGSPTWEAHRQLLRVAPDQLMSTETALGSRSEET